jgi:hypothetical protein
VGANIEGFGAHSLRATAATNALAILLQEGGHEEIYLEAEGLLAQSVALVRTPVISG